DAHIQAGQAPSEAATLSISGLAAEESRLTNDIVALEGFAEQAAAIGDYAAANRLRAAADTARQALAVLARARGDRADDLQEDFMAGDRKDGRRDGSDRDRETDLV